MGLIIGRYYFKLPTINPKMKPNIPNIMPAFIAALVACETENELLIKSQTKNTRPPNIPMNKQENEAYNKFTLMKSTPQTHLISKEMVYFEWII